MKSSYKPPFSISPKSINLIADIAAQIERYAIRMEQEDGLLLRKKNRIKTIHGSLAIEGNTLSENLITDIIEGKPVVAPLREIQEVKNAIKTYDIQYSIGNRQGIHWRDQNTVFPVFYYLRNFGNITSYNRFTRSHGLKHN